MNRTRTVQTPMRSLLPSGLPEVDTGLKKLLLLFPNRALRHYLHAAFDAVLDRYCPMAYQDETGFHYGKPERRSPEVQRPPGNS
jgi:hypothetical protein